MWFYCNISEHFIDSFCIIPVITKIQSLNTVNNSGRLLYCSFSVFLSF